MISSEYADNLVLFEAAFLAKQCGMRPKKCGDPEVIPKIGGRV